MLLFAFGLLFLMLCLAGWWLARGTRLNRGAVGLRAAIVLLLLAALTNPTRSGSPPPLPLVLLIDQSASLPGAQRAQLWQEAQRAAERLRPFRPVRLVSFGADAALATGAQPPAINPDGTDIAGALRFAAGLLPAGGEVVLVSDGGATTPAAAAEVPGIAAQGILINTVPLTTTGAEVRVESLRVPAALREGERFSADVIIWSSAAAQVRLDLSGDAGPLAGKTLDLIAGRNAISFQSQAGSRGFHQFVASIRASADQQDANNTLQAWTVVGPPPRVLVVERAPDSAATLRDALENAGLVTEAIRPATLPTRLSQLEAYDAIVLHDVAATTLSLDQQLALREYVRSLGHGLVVLGGTNSYSLGGYKGTPLEEVLPVSMEPPPRRERPQVTLLLMIDRSASMLGIPGQDKFSLAKAAAIAATESLGPDDTIGVLAFDTTTEWAVNFTQIGSGLNLSEIQTKIATIASGGGTNIYDALNTGLSALQNQPGRVRHAVLLTDGRSSTENSYEALVAPLRISGITLSTIAIGDDSDQPLLESLAKLGAGRYHFAAEPDELPRLTLQETEIARENPVAEGDFRANLVAPHPAIRGLDISTLPAFSGYIAVTPKPEAERLLESPEGDVVLATWQYGLGRATAWTSDAGDGWTREWPRWDGWGPFLAQIVAATYPDPASGPLRIESRVQGAQATIELDALSEVGEPIDLADVGLRLVAPSGGEHIVRAQQVGPGRYTAAVELREGGAYQVLAALEQPALRLEARAGLVRPYSAEWSTSPDAVLLAQVALGSGGRVESLAALTTPPAELARVRPPHAWWPWLVGAALLLWLAEVALRRGWLRWVKR
jgi:uncharacterized membrane protein